MAGLSFLDKRRNKLLLRETDDGNWKDLQNFYIYNMGLINWFVLLCHVIEEVAVTNFSKK